MEFLHQFPGVFDKSITLYFIKFQIIKYKIDQKEERKRNIVMINSKIIS